MGDAATFVFSAQQIQEGTPVPVQMVQSYTKINYNALVSNYCTPDAPPQRGRDQDSGERQSYSGGLFIQIQNQTTIVNKHTVTFLHWSEIQAHRSTAWH